MPCLISIYKFISVITDVDCLPSFVHLPLGFSGLHHVLASKEQSLVTQLAGVIINLVLIV